MITQTWLPRLGFGLSAFPLYAYGGELIERGGALATDAACCCQEGSFCSPCTQCVRGAWVTIPAFSVSDVTSLTCECASVAGTYYIPIGPAGINCTPSVPYSPFCLPTNTFGSVGECLWENRPPFYSCQGCLEVYWEGIPGCDDNSPGVCNFTNGGVSHKIRGAIGWGVHAVKEGGFWRFRGYITYLDLTFFGIWIKDFTSSQTGETADCTAHNGDYDYHCGGDPCDAPGTTASLLLDFGVCP